MHLHPFLNPLKEKKEKTNFSSSLQALMALEMIEI